jgi:hypothetical protein
MPGGPELSGKFFDFTLIEAAANRVYIYFHRFIPLKVGERSLPLCRACGWG